MKVKSLLVGALMLAAGAIHGIGAQEIQISKTRKLPPLPDLVVMRATYDQAAQTVNVWVMNRAKDSKAAGCTLKLYGLRHKGLLVKEKLQLTRAVPALAGGQSYTTVFELPKPEGDIKTAVSKVIVDSDNVIHESNEGNNAWAFFKDDSARNGRYGTEFANRRTLCYKQCRVPAAPATQMNGNIRTQQLDRALHYRVLRDCQPSPRFDDLVRRIGEIRNPLIQPAPHSATLFRTSSESLSET